MSQFSKLKFVTKNSSILSIIFLIVQSVSAQNPPPQIAPLELNKPVESEIAAKETHNYQITLAENQYASITVEQRGIDVAVIVLGTDKKAFVQRDLILKTEGQEKIDFVALTAGVYILEIGAKPKSVATGRYTVLLTEIRESTSKERNLEEARKLHNESIELYGKGKYDEALAVATRAVEIREKESGAEHIDVAGSLANLALILHEKGDYEKAIISFQRSLKIREKVFGTYHQDVARTMHNLARSQIVVSNSEESIRLYEKAIEIREKILGADSPDLATSLNSLGVVYSNLGDYDKAEQLMRRALEIKEKTLSPNSVSIAASLSSLAGIYSRKGDEEKSIELYQRALAIREKSLDPDHPEVARSLDYLATAYRTKGNYIKAETDYLRALNILQKAFGLEHYRIARTLGNLAVLYQLKGDYAKAEPLFVQTVEMMEKTVGKTHTDYATALYNLAKFYTDKGDYPKAEPFYQQAISIAEKLFGSQHPDVITYLNGLGRNYLANGETNQAINLWSLAHKLSEGNIQLILFTNSERQKLLYLDSLSGETNQYISAHLKFAPSDSTALETALTTIFERKGRVLDAMAFEFASLRNRFDKDDQILLDKLKKVTSQLSQKILNGAENISLETHQKEIKNLEEQKENLEVEISRKNSLFRSQIQPVTIVAIKSAIPENSALIEFGVYCPFDAKAVGEKKAFGEPRYFAYIIHNQGEIKWKDLGETKQIDDSIELFRATLRDPKRNDVQKNARVLDEKLMLPIRAMLGDSKQLFISPDGALNLIPFEALVDEKNRYLVENYSFTYLTSGRDLLRMQTARDSKNKPLLMANPAFGEPDSMPTVAAKRQSITATRNLSDTYFAPLSGTLQEARSIQTLFPDAAFLSEKEATETALKQSVAPRILHIATHGFFLEDNNKSTKIENPLLRSGLALAGANQRKGEKDDGILTALEASGLNLWGTKLVVLSACDTGLGEVKNGEGVYGLRRAFVVAGTESLVMSLWSVSDLVTRELMINYYKNLKQGMGRGESLRHVQLEMLKKPNRQHPFYWASFIQSGEWKGLESKK